MLSGMILRQTQDTLDLANGLSIEIQAASFEPSAAIRWSPVC
jgi:hypothetical protein